MCLAAIEIDPELVNINSKSCLSFTFKPNELNFICFASVLYFYFN